MNLVSFYSHKFTVLTKVLEWFTGSCCLQFRVQNPYIIRLINCFTFVHLVLHFFHILGLQMMACVKHLNSNCFIESMTDFQSA